MAITKVIKNMDEYFRFTTGNKLIVNHLTYMDSNDMDHINNRLTTIYNGDTIITAPHCDCGMLKGRYLLGVECHECETLCEDPKDKTKPELWFESLDGSLPFINPFFWNMLNNALPGRINVLRWLSDIRYNPKGVIPNYAILAKESVLNGNRSYIEILNNMDDLLAYLVNSTELKTKSTHSDLVLLKGIHKDHKQDIYSNYLPILNKKLFVVENTTKGIYTNLVLGDIKDAIIAWLKASKPDTTYNTKISSTGTLVNKLAELYIKYYSKYLISKPGIFRKHVYGGRSHFTFRTVITATCGKHKHNEIVVPWLISLTTYRPHMLNKLVKRGYSYKDADNLINKHMMSYHPVIKEIQQELIDESPHEQGLPVIVNRNQYMGSSL